MQDLQLEEIHLNQTGEFYFQDVIIKIISLKVILS
jgi:hypothetical protein